MNLLEKVCKELGVAIDEIWEGNDGQRYRITSKGIIEWYAGNEGDQDLCAWIVSKDSIYKQIFMGELKPAWRPSIGNIYYIPNISANRNLRYRVQIFDNTEVDNWYLDKGLIFSTKDEAIEYVNELMGIS